MVRLFQETIMGDWIYPCDLAELEARLATIPKEHLEGLRAVGLTCSTEKRQTANGRYTGGDKPMICLCSQRADLRYKHSAETKDKDMSDAFVVERAYGMRVEKIGSRFWSCWDAELWKEFVLDYVLRHEIGHHIYWTQFEHPPRTWDRYEQQRSELFAERYAQEHSRLAQLIHPKKLQYIYQGDGWWQYRLHERSDAG